MSSELLLEVDGLSKSYRSKRRRKRNAATLPDGGVHRALVDVSIGVRRGDVLGIVGESGSGKSTLARCITLLERPDAGRVVLDGIDLTALSPKALRSARRRIQIVFQDPYASLNPRLTVGSALTEVLRVHKLEPSGRMQARLAELLDMVGLPANAATRFPADFSGGQRQRICIARALAASPDVLIADEAVSSLDVSIQAQVLNLLMELLDELRFTMVFISHDLHVVARIAPTIAVMFAGRVVEVLPAGVPLEAAVHPYTQTLLAALPSLHAGRAKVSDGADASLSTAATGCPFSERCPVAFERCVENPALLPVVEGHLVACHKVART